MMHMPKITLCVLVAVAVTGCMTTSAQRTYNSMDTTLSNIGAEMKACVTSVWSAEPELENTLSIKTAENPSIVRNNKSFIKKADEKAVTALMNDMKQCRERGHGKIQNHPDDLVRSFAPISESSIQLRHDVFQKYLNGEISAGSAASSLENVRLHLIEQWTDHEQKIIAQLNQLHFQEKDAQAAMLQSIGAGFQDYSHQQHQSRNTHNQSQVNRPVHTQCRWNAGVMDCTSYKY